MQFDYETSLENLKKLIEANQNQIKDKDRNEATTRLHRRIAF